MLHTVINFILQNPSVILLIIFLIFLSSNLYWKLLSKYYRSIVSPQYNKFQGILLFVIQSIYFIGLYFLSSKMKLANIFSTKSHIEIWKLISESEKNFTLILEDDVYFKYNFANEVDSIWDELYEKNKDFDILFLSYEYVKSIKNDESLNRNKVKVNRVSEGIWQASGYILSKKGAEKLLKQLPVYGPVDLWLNLTFSKLEPIFLKNQ